MKTNTLNKMRNAWKQCALGLAMLAGTANAGTWAQSAWTGDANSGIGTASVPASAQADYTVAVNSGTATAVTVNGINFVAHATSGTNFNMGGGFTTHPGGTGLVSGASNTLAAGFLYNGSPRTVTLLNLTVGEKYETSFFAFGWDALPYDRAVTFSSGSDSLRVNQNFYGQNQGIRISYTFVAAATSQVLTLTPGPGGNGGTFHMSALANRKIPTPPATITLFGTNVAGSSAVISPVVANAGTIAWTVPYGTTLATLAPTFSMYSGAATCDQTSGAVPSPNFGSGSVSYIITDGATVNTYTVTASVGPPSTARDITAFNPNFAGSSAAITSTGPNTGTVVVFLPKGTPAAIAGILAPTFTLSGGATCDRVSGVRPTPALSIGGTVVYTVTAQDGVSTKTYDVTVQRSGWAISPWTGDADSGVGGVQTDYTVAVNTGTTDTAASTLNGITFSAHAMTGTNHVIAGATATAGRATNLTGDSAVLANNFIYNSSPRTITLNNLTAEVTYETSIFTYAWDATPGRTQRFESSGDSFLGDGSAYGNNNGARISYTFVAPAGGSKVLNITQTGVHGTFHMSALANRVAISAPGDTDADDLADTWEMEKAGNLTELTGLLLGPGPGAGSGDFDNDGLSDAEEFVRYSAYPALDPKAADTDSDGLTDGAELYPTAPRVATNPTVADTDGDGYNDFVEDNSGVYGGAGSPGTSPTSVDSDGDQYPDAYEIGMGGNPVLNSAFPTILPAGIALGVVTDEASTGIQASDLATYTHKISGGSPATVNGVALDVLDTATTPANFNWNRNAGGKNIIGPAINNGTWNPVAGNVTGPGNLQMFGTFTYSGGGGAPGSKQQFTLSALEPGLTYEMRVFIRKWDDGTVRPQYLKFTNGAAVTNYYILEDRPELVLGNSNRESAYYISFTYVAQSDTMTMEATVANVSSGNGSFHMYGLTNRSTSLPPPPDFNSIVRAANVLSPTGFRTTLDVKTRVGRIYALSYSTDLVTWIELGDTTSTSTSTIFVDDFASNFLRTYYRVDDLTP